MNKQLIERVKEEFVILGLFSKVKFNSYDYNDEALTINVDGRLRFTFETEKGERTIHVFREAYTYKTKDDEEFLKYVSKLVLEMMDK